MQRQISSVQSRGKLLFVALCVGVGVAAVAIQALGSFGKARGFAVGSSPSSVAIGDFNGDGRRDMAVANARSRNVSILLGSRAGSFREARNFAAGSNPNALAIAKVNGDPKRDIVLATGSGVSVLLGHGDGTFGPPTNLSAGINPWSVVVGNFDADANLDLAVANGGSVECDSRVARAHASSCVGGFGTVSVLLGRGDGTFGIPTNFPVGEATQPIAMVVGNFNGDTKPDLALANFAQYANSVSVLLGKGDGTFGNASFFAVDSSPNSIAVGDLNQDSHDDLAVAGRDSPKSVSVLLGRGDGGFGTATSLSAGAGNFGTPTAIAIGNLNAGLNPDLAVTISSSRPGASRVVVLLNAGPSRRRLTITYSRSQRSFTGRLSSADPTCVSAQRVKVLRRRPGPDRQVGSAISAADGTYRIGAAASPGTYYARVRAWSACRAAISKLIKLHS